MRFAKVLLWLVTLGASAGALVGGIILGLLALVGPIEVFGVGGLKAFAAACAFGAGVGAITGPPIALLFLRAVPLWRATLETAAAAGVGAVVATRFALPYGWIYLTLACALAAAARLHFAYRHSSITSDVQ